MVWAFYPVPSHTPSGPDPSIPAEDLRGEVTWDQGLSVSPKAMVKGTITHTHTYIHKDTHIHAHTCTGACTRTHTHAHEPRRHCLWMLPLLSEPQGPAWLPRNDPPGREGAASTRGTSAKASPPVGVKDQRRNERMFQEPQQAKMNFLPSGLSSREGMLATCL